MPLNQIYAPTIVRPVAVDTEVDAGTPLDVNGTPAIAYTASGGNEITVTNGVGRLVSATYNNGGAGLDENEVSAAFDGSYNVEVTGADENTENGVPVYLITSGTGEGTLNLDSGAGSSRINYGVTDYPKDYTKEAGRASVRIGAVNG